VTGCGRWRVSVVIVVLAADLPNRLVVVPAGGRSASGVPACADRCCGVGCGEGYALVDRIIKCKCFLFGYSALGWFVGCAWPDGR